jgi:thiosulfate sulfurtransferase
MTVAEHASYHCIPAAEAIELIGADPALAIFDVRDLAAYRLGHLPDAAHLSEDRLLPWFRRLAKGRPVLIYCYHGHASMAYAQMFADFGFFRVYSVDGGYAPLAASLAGGEKGADQPPGVADALG